jgi:dienelactone hydrolase
MLERPHWLIGFALAVAACSSDDEGNGAAGGVAGMSGTGGVAGSGGNAGTAGAGGSAGSAGSSGTAGAAQCSLSEIETIANEPTHVVQRFAYVSTGGLKIRAEVCRPQGAGPHPTLVWNHGGFQGLGGSDRDLCVNAAKNAGWATFMSEYRGEGGSEGAIEVCLGEADDVLALVGCAADQPDVDAGRMLMAGGSHGGCITLRALGKGAPVAAAVDIFGPTDWAKEHAFWTAALAADPQGPWAAAYQALIPIMEQAAGGSPTQAPAAYDARSPVKFAVELAAHPGDLLIVHGVEDALVPPDQSCSLAQAVGLFEARHYDASAQTALATPPAGCEASTLQWLTSPKPSPTWPGARYLVVYDGANHGLSAAVPGEAAMADDFLTFLVAKMPP